MTTAEQRGREAAEPTATSGPRPPRTPPRWVRWTVVPLLVLVPLGYVVISAEQSRASGPSARQQQAGERLTQVHPTQLEQRIYQVPIPPGARSVRNMEQNSWNSSELYAEFVTNAGGLDTFLARVGTSRAALTVGKVTITAAQSKAVGWNFGIPHTWAGVKLTRPGDKPDHTITVDLTHPDRPRVYVVSTVNFRHGFHGLRGDD
ncbi:hypothetical protein [Actinacidiphila yeochonensis]|uniref:hypothetical protein n=1 Tax=Actinacidiphila yeochonensis TaxID=89050 RepID=UPI000A693D6A|nr:hypothetical protein [Actinacidiphila yeochonensis]